MDFLIKYGRGAGRKLLAPQLLLTYYTAAASLLLCALWFIPPPPGRNSLFFQASTHFFFLPLLSACTGFLAGRWVRRAWFVPLIPPGVESLAMLLNRPGIALARPGAYFSPFLLYLILGGACMGLSLLLRLRWNRFPRLEAVLAVCLCLLIFYPASHLAPPAGEAWLWRLFFPPQGAALGLWAGTRWKKRWFAPLLAYLPVRACWPAPEGLGMTGERLALVCGGICAGAMALAALSGWLRRRRGRARAK